MGSIQQLFPTGSFGSVSATNGVVTGSATVGSLILPTNGGTATPLTYYEELSIPGFVWNSANFSPTTQTVTLTLVRIGSIVTLHFPSIAATGTGVGGTGLFISGSTLPARFCPPESNAQVSVIPGTAGSSFTISLQVNYLGTTGQLALGQNSGQGFTNASGTVYGNSRDAFATWNLL